MKRYSWRDTLTVFLVSLRVSRPCFCCVLVFFLGGRFLSSAGAGGNCARPTRLPDPSPVLDKNRAPMGPEKFSSTGAGVWRKAPMAFPDSSSVLDKFQSAIFSFFFVRARS